MVIFSVSSRAFSFLTFFKDAIRKLYQSLEDKNEFDVEQR